MAKTRRARTRPPLVPPAVTIRAFARNRLVEHTLPAQASLERLAEEWTYVLRSRARWLDDPGQRQAKRERAQNDLATLGLPLATLKQLAVASHIEVELHPWDTGDAPADAVFEAASSMPWEYLLSAATRESGRHRPMLVTRLLRNDAPAVITGPPRRVLLVESAPGRLRDLYDFEQEEERLRAALGADAPDGTSGTPARTVGISATESVTELKKTVRAEWDVLHVTGVDTHQAGWVVDGFYDNLDARPARWKRILTSREEIRDGMILREANLPELPVPYDELAEVLISPQHRPWLVTLNLYYSGARIARELVRRGAHASMGFLDEIDDELAERFFQAFYWAWCRQTGTRGIPHAFVEAWGHMAHQPVHGTAIVIWMGRSVFDEYAIAPQAEFPEVPKTETRRARLERIDDTPVAELLQVQLDVPKEINYSLLHNNRSLLNRLTLTKLASHVLEDITVDVELNLGADNYRYRATHLVLDEPQREIGPDVRIPLTGALPRSLRERVHSTVYVKVTCHGRTALETTERVTLIPVDEWVDDTEDNPWLPSFVLPRDPAVLRVIASARKYLIGINDDPSAGFDGYQSIDEASTSPTAGVDAQVRAIWTAIVNDYRLQYINPPPAYSDQSQRLRTPSDILASNTGTCIDLALLLASCLEYIDVYSVIVLLEGHAFVGYWRSDSAHEAFAEVAHVPLEVPPAGSALARSSDTQLVEKYRWRLTRMHYDEIMEYVSSGDLVMLEATLLTSASSFVEAIKEGRANMRSRREFDSLLDVRLARTAAPPITPLPIILD
jgi:hypothetical protein